MKQAKHDFSRFKTEINLTQYAAHLGYEINKKKSTRSSIVMKQGSDKVIISRQGAKWVYFSVSNDDDNGTIVDFIENRTNKSLCEIGKELNSWIGGSVTLPEPRFYAQDVEEQKPDPQRVRQIFKRCRVAYKHHYLAGRGIEEGVLGSERFAGRIYVDRYHNAVFPHYNNQGVCGLELKGEEAAYFVKGSEKTLWRSNSKKGDDTLIIGEASIDVLSHYVLFPYDKAIYTATGGGMSPEQGNIIHNFVENFDGLKTVILITDNDEGGDKLVSKIKGIIAKSDFKGEVKRHSPQQRGRDWNEILTSKEKV